jgi:hypothetical protein
MKIAGLNFKIEREKSKERDDDEWKKLKYRIDRIFDVTNTERDEMDKNLRHYNGEIFPETGGLLRSDESRAKHNIAFSAVQSIAPMLSDNKPITTVVARENYLQGLANAYDLALSYFWDKSEMNMVIHEVVLDAMIQKVGLFKIYFDPDLEGDGECRVVAENPREFFIAPGYTDPWEAPYCGIRGKRPLSLIRKRFDPDRTLDLKPDEGDDWKDRGISYGKAKDFELNDYFCTLYEIWMRDDETEEDLKSDDEDEVKKLKKIKYPHGKFVYFTNDTYLGTEKCEYWHGKAPWVPFYNYKKPHDFLGTSELDNIKDLAKEYNLMLIKLAGYIRKYTDPNTFYDSNQINQENFADKAVKGGQYFAYDGTESGKPPITYAQPGAILSDLYQMLGLIPKIVEEETGATDVSKGIASKKQRQSASEIAVLVESSYTRTRQRVRNLEWSLKRVCWLLVNLMQQYYGKERTLNFHQGDEFVQDSISNKMDYAENVVGPNRVAISQKQQAGGQLSQREQQEWEDYQNLITSFGTKDPVYFDYSIEIQTNSSLPLDKQSLANLGLRLYTAPNPAIDRAALLELLHFPDADEINARMEAKEQQQQQAKQPQGGGMPTEGTPIPGPENAGTPGMGEGMGGMNE